MRYYLAGPMRGHPQHNFPAFFDAERVLADLGHEILSPARREADAGFDWENDSAGTFTCADLVAALRWDLDQILDPTTDGVVFLPHWEPSRGARAEHALAVALDKPCYLYVEPRLSLTRLVPLDSA